MESIYNYFEFPNVEEAHRITQDIKKIRLKVKYEIQSDYAYADEFDYYDNVLPWIYEFNFTMLNIEIPYILLCNYYNKNIPEYSEKKYNDNKYEKKDYINKYYFNYFSRICLFEIESNFERTIHIISNLYDLRMSKGEMIKDIVIKLKNKDLVIFNYLTELQKNPIYRNLKDLRNQLTHNFSPLRTKMLPTYDTNGITHYGEEIAKSSTEIKNVIEDSLKLLKEYVDFLGNYIEEYYIKKFNRK